MYTLSTVVGLANEKGININPIAIKKSETIPSFSIFLLLQLEKQDLIDMNPCFLSLQTDFSFISLLVGNIFTPPPHGIIQQFVYHIFHCKFLL